jgi:hypothetical protein
MMRYKILWFDDQFNILEKFREEAFLEGLQLEGVSNAQAGIEILRKEIENYDAVLLDGLFFKSGETNVATDLALAEVAKVLTTLEYRKKLPWFILSGAVSFTHGENKYAAVYKENKVYNKAITGDRNQLWQDIKLAVSESPDAQVRKNHAKAFEALPFVEISPSSEKDLLDILKSISNPGVQLQDSLYFTQLRIILEQLFRKANKLGLLHEKCLENGKVNLAESSLFLSGEQTKHLGVKCKKAHFPKIISDAVRNILFVTGAASHTVEADQSKNINLQEFRITNGTPYLLYSLTFQLLDVLIWFKNYASANSDLERNKALWESTISNGTAIHSGIIQQDMQGNYFCGSYSLAKTYVEGKFKIGDGIRITESKENTGNSKSIYPNFASKFEKDI